MKLIIDQESIDKAVALLQEATAQHKYLAPSCSCVIYQAAVKAGIKNLDGVGTKYIVLEHTRYFLDEKGMEIAALPCHLWHTVQPCTIELTEDQRYAVDN